MPAIQEVPKTNQEGANYLIPMPSHSADRGNLSRDMARKANRQAARGVALVGGVGGTLVAGLLVASGASAQENSDGTIDPNCLPASPSLTLESAMPSESFFSPNPDGSFDVFVSPSSLPSQEPGIAQAVVDVTTETVSNPAMDTMKSILNQKEGEIKGKAATRGSIQKFHNIIWEDYPELGTFMVPDEAPEFLSKEYVNYFLNVALNPREGVFDRIIKGSAIINILVLTHEWAENPEAKKKVFKLADMTYDNLVTTVDPKDKERIRVSIAENAVDFLLSKQELMRQQNPEPTPTPVTENCVPEPISAIDGIITAESTPTPAANTSTQP